MHVAILTGLLMTIFLGLNLGKKFIIMTGLQTSAIRTGLMDFLSGLAGVVFQPLGWIFSWPCWFLLTYIIKIVEWFS